MHLYPDSCSIGFQENNRIDYARSGVSILLQTDVKNGPISLLFFEINLHYRSITVRRVKQKILTFGCDTSPMFSLGLGVILLKQKPKGLSFKGIYYHPFRVGSPIRLFQVWFH